MRSSLFRTLILGVALVVLAVISTSCFFGSSTSDDGTVVTPAGSTSATTSTTVVKSTIVPDLTSRFLYHAKRMLDIKGLLYDTASPVTGANFRKVVAQDTVAGSEVPEGYKVILTLETPPPVGGIAVAVVGGTTGGTSVTAGDSGADGGDRGTGDSDGADGSDSGSDSGGTTTTTTGGGATTSTTSTTTTTTSGVKPVLVIASASPGNFGTGLPEDTVKSINVHVVNTGLATAFCPQVTTIVSRQGVILGSASARLAPYSLGPGEAAFGRVIVNIDDVDNTVWITDGLGQYDVEYVLSFQSTDSTCGSFTLSVADDELVTGSSGMKAVVGDATNITSASPIDAYVTVVALDEDGDVIEVVNVRLDYMLLSPGESTSFYAQFDYARDIDSYKIIAFGETL